MEEHWGCGTSIAKLSNSLGETIGWVIQWENDELSILWLGDDYDPESIEPALPVKTLEAATSKGSAETIKILENLSSRKRNCR